MPYPIQPLYGSYPMTPQYTPAMYAQPRLAEQMYPQYAQQQAQVQQQQASFPNSQPLPLNGRVVDDIATVTFNEIPQNGDIAIFPMSDMSAVYCRKLEANGTVKTIVYKPQIEDKRVDTDKLTSETEKRQIDLSDESTAVFMKRFDEIEKQIDSLKSNLSGKVVGSRAKRESDAE